MNRPTIYSDSQSTIRLIDNLVYHAKTKHIEVWYHQIRELVTKKKIEVLKIDTKVNTTNCVTKPLPNQHFGTLRTMMGLRQAIEQKKAEWGATSKN